MKHVEFYRNDKDGSVLVSVGTQVPEKLIYAGQELTHLVADTVDAAKEKHVPAIQKIDGHLEVHVGSVTHPMEEKHYIEWIALVDDNGVDIRYLKPGEEPKAEFETGDAGEVYAYCNLHGLWKDKGLVILGFPCNQFLEQDPEDNQHIEQFCRLNHGVTFPLFAKIDVRGDQAAPLYQYLTGAAPFKGYETDKESGQLIQKVVSEYYPDNAQGNGIKWNFTKFLINRDGSQVQRFEPSTTPEELDPILEKLLLS